MCRYVLACVCFFGGVTTAMHIHIVVSKTICRQTQTLKFQRMYVLINNTRTSKWEDQRTLLIETISGIFSNVVVFCYCWCWVLLVAFAVSSCCVVAAATATAVTVCCHCCRSYVVAVVVCCLLLLFLLSDHPSQTSTHNTQQ